MVMVKNKGRMRSNAFGSQICRQGDCIALTESCTLAWWVVAVNITFFFSATTTHIKQVSSTTAKYMQGEKGNQNATIPNTLLVAVHARAATPHFEEGVPCITVDKSIGQAANPRTYNRRKQAKGNRQQHEQLLYMTSTIGYKVILQPTSSYRTYSLSFKNPAGVHDVQAGLHDRYKGPRDLSLPCLKSKANR